MKKYLSDLANDIGLDMDTLYKLKCKILEETVLSQKHLYSFFERASNKYSTDIFEQMLESNEVFGRIMCTYVFQYM